MHWRDRDGGTTTTAKGMRYWSEHPKRTVCFLDTFTLSCLSSSIQQQEVKPNGEEEKKLAGKSQMGCAHVCSHLANPTSQANPILLSLCCCLG